MDANGGSMGRRWQREIHALELIIDAPWLQVVRSANKYGSFSLLLNFYHNLNFW